MACARRSARAVATPPAGLATTRRGSKRRGRLIASNVTPTAPSALYATRGGGPGGLTIIAILDLLGGAAQCMVAAGPMHGIQLPATDTCKCIALYGGLCCGVCGYSAAPNRRSGVMGRDAMAAATGR